MAISLVLFICFGLALGWGNARFTQMWVDRIADSEAVGVGALALFSGARLIVLTGVSVAVAFLVRPGGVGILVGLAIFQAFAPFWVARPMWRGRT
ncbi:hypothetical protein [Nocardia sp. XZ_19_385]|uniref:hypothetical protein n=1 Tax=Nocardia sp. XZ_19_385 TaxID=2769488 RepID=UPI00188F8FB6|nr:hypothetical protein [Nocardia sp. XZ_19_385]